MLRSLFASLMILLAAPACAGKSRVVNGFHSGGFHGGGVRVFHHRRHNHRFFFGGYLCGYNCGWGFDSEGYDYGDGDGYDNAYSYGHGYPNGYADGYRGGTGNAVSSSNGPVGGYVPDPVGADIPPMIIPTNCWVRRAAYDPSGAYFGKVLINLCRTPERVMATGSRALAKTPETGIGTTFPRPHQTGRRPVTLRRLLVEKPLKSGATLNYRSRPLLQLAIYPFEEWCADHMQTLLQS